MEDFNEAVQCLIWCVIGMCFPSIMDVKAPWIERFSGTTCVYWLAGRCNRNFCGVLHRKIPASATRKGGTSDARASHKPSQSICRYWVNGNCVHLWFYGDGFSTLAKLQEHKKVVTGIALPIAFDKLYSGSTDGTACSWDCHTGQCANVIKLDAEVNSLISEGPWIFVGVRKYVKAWNIQTASEFNLDGPKGQVLALNVGNGIIFAGAEDGVISAWRGSCEAHSPFELVASLSCHTKAVVCLAVGGKMLYMDHSTKVWDLEDTLEWKMTLNGHTGVVTSFICWDQYLLSSSLSSSSDCTIKVWAAIEDGTLEVIYTHTEEKMVFLHYVG